MEEKKDASNFLFLIPKVPAESSEKAQAPTQPEISKDAKEESKELNTSPEQKDILSGEEVREDIEMEAKELVSSGRPLVFSRKLLK